MSASPRRLATVSVDGQLVTVAVSSFSSAGGAGRIVGDATSGLFFPSEPGEEITFAPQQLAPVVPRPGKVVCVGLNFREHIEEMGHPVPDHPTLFAKFPNALTGAHQRVRVPEGMQEQCDYEGELAVIVGPRGADGRAEIAGYAVCNDFSQRDWQYRTQQWLQGKNVDASSAFGPWMTVAEDYDPVVAGAMLRTWVNGELRQEHSLADLVFKPEELVEYIDRFSRVEAGDVIICGTPAGVGHGMKPPQYLEDGDVVKVEIEGLGRVVSEIYHVENSELC
ncbi:MAG TPA: fumarylacetoacetate hydrolase family protein [Candidatus Corynebacterium gallistercoris]|uniref:Fumarylacetoacetate hydrolase family protein n=1 Tax=Candidatus Corynebacterium gallistercoris TaxID=2838530 RepID=A0A9D1RXR4_9CORY|nr:fumarylacetoacetate hydrolase family protein [Candidatus Corynebacterium gallistercoris]